MPAACGTYFEDMPLLRWQQMWPWIGWPVVVIALFGIQQELVQRKG